MIRSKYRMTRIKKKARTKRKARKKTIKKATKKINQTPIKRTVRIKKKKEVKIEFDNIEQRMLILPIPAGNYGKLAGVSGAKVIISRYPNSGSRDEKSALLLYDLKEQKENVILSGTGQFRLSSDGKKMLVYSRGKYAIIKVAPKQKMDKAIDTKDLNKFLDPKEEWKQIFTDAWRIQRDYFYDKNMHGLDWDAIRKKYGDMINHANTRGDVNFYSR